MSSPRKPQVSKQSEIRSHLQRHQEQLRKDLLCILDVHMKNVESSLGELPLRIGEDGSSEFRSSPHLDHAERDHSRSGGIVAVQPLHTGAKSTETKSADTFMGVQSSSPIGSRVKRFLGREEKQKRQQSRSPFLVPRDKMFRWMMSFPKEPERTGFVARMVSSHVFESTTYFVIFVNTVFSTYAADWELQHLRRHQSLSSDTTLLITLTQVFFTIYYVFEIGLRIWVHRKFFFINNEAKWNLFDLIVSVTAAWDVLPLHEIGVDVKFLRTFRIIKLVKVFRVFRVVKAFSELRQMMQAMVGSVMSLSWALVMLALIIYMFSLFCLQGVIDYRRDQHDNLPSEVRTVLDAQFGSLRDTMRTIYIACLTGSWQEIWKCLSRFGFIYEIAFFFFTGFYTITVVNIITGIFLEKALVAALPDRAQMMLEERQRVAAEAVEIESLIRNMLESERRSGAEAASFFEEDSFSRGQFKKLVDDTDLEEYLTTIDIHIDDAKLFFDVIAALCGADDKIRIADFAGGLASMRGHATSFEVQQLLYGLKNIERAVAKHDQRFTSRIGLIEARLLQDTAHELILV